MEFSASAETEPAALLEARRALGESIPQVAIQKLRALLTTPDLAADARDAATLVLGEALLAAQQHDAALAALRPLGETGNRAAQLLEAHVLAAAGRWEAALAVYRLLARSAEAPATAQLGEAESLQALGRTHEAIAALEACVRARPGNVSARLRLTALCLEANQLPEARELLAATEPVSAYDRKWRQYLEARLLLAEDLPGEAAVIFDQLGDENQELPDSLRAAAALGSAEARIALQGYAEADVPLENFIGRYPESAHLELIFRRLDQIYAQQTNARESELHRLARKGQARRAALARFYVTRLQIRERKYEQAAANLQDFIRLYPTHPLLPQVQVMQADVALERGDFPGAVSALEAAMRSARSDEQRAEIELRTGLVHYRQREFLLAANFFHSAAASQPLLHERATFDAALAALGQRNYERFLETRAALGTQHPDSPLRSELALEHGLTQARTADASATATLQLFLEHFPTHARVPEARLALAELALGEGDSGGAAEYLRVVRETPGAEQARDQADYLALFLADAKTGRTDETVIGLGERFLREHATSPLLPEVRMKLGQLYFHRDDFANAETQFATLARETPESPYAETALFLAGESATRQINPGAVDRALALFDEVVKRGGALKLHARQQQAIVQSRLGKEAEAVTLYDVILAAQPPAEPELRFAALGGKGENLLALGRKDPAQSSAALAVFEQLAVQPDVTPAWRNQALYKKGKALEQMRRFPEALAAYYDVLDRSTGAEREYFWYYKAGFDAARIFEQQQQWKSAVGIYEKMARIEGPRSAAAARVRQLRLEKFLWE